jgi:hypothetical protein
VIARHRQWKNTKPRTVLLLYAGVFLIFYQLLILSSVKYGRFWVPCPVAEDSVLLEDGAA